MVLDFETISSIDNLTEIKSSGDYDKYFLALSAVIAIKSTCLRRRYGIAIARDNVLVGHGFNGNYDGCHRDCVVEGTCLRDDNNIDDNELFDPCLREEFSIVEDDEMFKGTTFYITSYNKRHKEFIPISISTEWIFKLSRMGVDRIVFGLPSKDHNTMEHL